MKQIDVTDFRTLLLARRAEIMSTARQREDIWIVPSNEQVETVQLAGERDFAVRTLERASKTLTQVRAALHRIEDGEYGICLECEEPISPKRLAAVPWAAYCLQCQEARDARDERTTIAEHAAAA